MGFDDNNGGIFNKGSQQLIFLTVLDQNGNPVDGAVVKDAVGDKLNVITGSKGNIRKQAYGKLAFTLIDKSSGRAVRVSYKPALQRQIGATAFMQKRAAGIYPNEIPEEEVMEPVNLIWDAPEEDVLVIEPVYDYPGSFYPEVMGFERCARCGELVALPYLRVANGKHSCIPCSDYDR